MRALAVLALSVVAACSPPSPESLRRSSFAWTAAELVVGFANWDLVYPGREVARGGWVRDLPPGPPLGGLEEKEVDRFLSRQRVAGLLVLHEGRVRLERYGLGHSEAGRWTSQSVAKSVTSTLVGAAVRDGFIWSIDEPVTTYIPDLRGSAYDDVTIRHLMTMTSGVRWTEDYSDPRSDVSLFYSTPVEPGLDATVSYMRGLPAEATPGMKWVYKTGETHLLGVLVTAATGQSLAAYLSRKIWEPYGMEQSASWSIDRTDHETGGCCLQAALRDYARFGQFVLDDGRIDGQAVVPDDWFEVATSSQVAIGSHGRGYGFQWWISADGTFQAIGIHGQLIHIDRSRHLVVAINSAWPEPLSRKRSVAQANFLTAITRSIDDENARNGSGL